MHYMKRSLHELVYIIQNVIKKTHTGVVNVRVFVYVPALSSRYLAGHILTRSSHSDHDCYSMREPGWKLGN